MPWQDTFNATFGTGLLGGITTGDWIRVLRDNGFPVTPFRRVGGPDDFDRARRALGVPGVLKTADFGYDGKGQTKVDANTEINWEIGFGGSDHIYEAFVDFAAASQAQMRRTASAARRRPSTPGPARAATRSGSAGSAR